MAREPIPVRSLLRLTSPDRGFAPFRGRRRSNSPRRARLRVAARGNRPISLWARVPAMGRVPVGLSGILLAGVLCIAPAHAFTLTEDQPIDFGRFIVAHNTGSTSVVLSTAGEINSNGSILVYKDAQAGAYTITGAPPLAALTITITPDPLDLTIVNNRFFRVDNFTVSSSTTDESGELTFTVGATITSDGDGVYNGANYKGHYIVTVTNP